MTDSRPFPSPAPHNPPSNAPPSAATQSQPAPAEHSGRKVTTIQVGASAAAAVTAALAASLFGAAGTLIGAALGSVVSTVAGAIYADYMHRGVKATKSVVIQRIPSDVLASTPLRRLTGPTDLPGQESLQPIGDEAGDESISVPLADRADLVNAGPNASPGGTPNGVYRPAPARTSRSWFKRPLVTAGAIGVAGFGIAMGTIVSAEGVIGHPVSGGSGGTTFSHLGSTSDRSSTTPTSTPTPTATSKVGATKGPGASPAATTTAPVETSAAAPTTSAAAATTDAGGDSAAATGGADAAVVDPNVTAAP